MSYVMSSILLGLMMISIRALMTEGRRLPLKSQPSTK
jgi:hypothetical protein